MERVPPELKKKLLLRQLKVKKEVKDELSQFVQLKNLFFYYYKTQTGVANALTGQIQIINSSAGRTNKLPGS